MSDTPKIQPDGLPETDDSLKKITEYQANQFNPGYYVGTGKVPPAVEGTGNTLPASVLCFLGSLAFGAFGLFLLIRFPASGDQVAGKVLSAAVFLLFALLLVRMGVVYLKKAKKYRRSLREQKAEPVSAQADEMWQRTCPVCGRSHDLDYPRCPYCKHDYGNKR